jgi:Hemerythrin HHE cation binding domain.
MNHPMTMSTRSFGRVLYRLIDWLGTRLAIVTLFAPAPARANSEEGAKKRVTEPFREEHAGIREHLGHIQQKAGTLRAAAPGEQKMTMRFISKFLNEHIRPHAEWEEKVLYPVVDRLAKSGVEAFTSTMRFEHGVVGRWIDELTTESEQTTPDVEAFGRRTDNLLGLLAAHFEEEEEVLLPLVEKGMSPEQFKREIMDKMEPHG